MRRVREQEARACARLEDLEERLGEDSEARLERLVDVVAARLPAVLEGPGHPGISWSGYFDIKFRDDHAGDGPTTFDQHRFVLNLAAPIMERFTFNAEVEIEGGGVGASYLTESEVVIEFAELSFELWEAFNVKAGALLVPFNRFNLLHDSPLQDLTDRPLVDRRIIPTTWAEAGVGIYGAFHPSPWISFDYDVILGNGLTEEISTSGGMRAARGSRREDNNDSKMVIGRVGATVDFPFLDVFNAGFSLAHGKYDDAGREDLTMIGFDWTLKKGPFEVVGEYVHVDLSRGMDQIAAGVPGGMERWYAELRCHFFPDSWCGGFPLFTDTSTFTFVVRYGEVDTNEDGTAVDFAARGDRYRDDRRRLTLGLNFRPIEDTVIKLEYQWFFEPSGIPEVDNNRFVASFATYF